MNRINYVIGFIFFSIMISAQSQPKQIVEEFFKGFHAKDTVILQKLCHSSISMQTVSNATEGSRLKLETAEDFYKSIASIPADFSFEERILEYKVQTDGNMAHVWTPYEFYVNGKLSHIGVNSFTMIKEPEGFWKIVHIIDTRRKK
jgi:hypothetical protein